MSCVPGACLPALLGAYDHDHAANPHHPDWTVPFSPVLAYRYLGAARGLGLAALRLWLCENGEGVRIEDGEVVGVDPALIEAIRVWQDGARCCGIRLYWSVLDANAWLRNGCDITGGVLGDPARAARFAERVLAPIAATLDAQVSFGLELVNEPESASAEVEAERGLPWSVLRTSLDVLGKVAQEYAPLVPRSVGTQACFLEALWGEQAPSWLSAVDVHVYHPSGGLPPRADLPSVVRSLPLWAGEAGASHETPGDNSYLVNALFNGRREGYAGVFLWQLEGDLLERRADDRGHPVFFPTPLGEAVRATLTPGAAPVS